MASPSYILRCQEDSHLRSLSGTTVVECLPLSDDERAKVFPAPIGETVGNKKKDVSSTVVRSAPAQLFKVLLSETILFPEGGGQPCDFGELIDEDDVGSDVTKVLSVFRDSETGATWALTERALAANRRVTVVVDWPRRFDHMVHHSAQHLISALALRDFGLKTVGWSLTPAGPSRDTPCYVDLEGPDRVSEVQLHAIEAAANLAIAASLAMTPMVYSSEEFHALCEAGDVRFKALPNSAFPVRTVEISGLDVNTCCGTHVRSTAELGIIKLLRAEGLTATRASEGSKRVSRMVFIAGDRARAMLGTMYERQRRMTDALKCAPNEHAARATAATYAAKDAQKGLRAAHKELGALLAPKLAQQAVEKAVRTSQKTVLCCYHRSDGTHELLHALEKALLPAIDDDGGRIRVLAMLSIGDEQQKPAVGGAYVIVGNGMSIADGLVQKGNAIMLQTFQARGGGKDARFQGKVPAGHLTVKSITQAHEDLAALVQTMQ